MGKQQVMFQARRYFLLVSCLLVFYSLSCSKNGRPELYEFKGRTMGTFYSIKLVTESGRLDYDKMSVKINDILDGVNQIMSTYIDSSELSRLNQYREKDWKEISPELYTVLKEANRISRLSNGAFDITVGPLVNLWGFGTEGHKDHQPDKEQIEERKKEVGYKNLSIKEGPFSAKKEIPELYCDLSAIAKGYGVDVVANYFDSTGINNYLVEVGGEIRARGKNQSLKDWRIGVQSPNVDQGVFAIISISSRAVATSGDYQNYFEENGIRFSHTIDPVTGKPISHKLASVTVVHDSCMTADALATAINVLGPEKGFELAKSLDLAVFLIVRENDGFVEKMTPQFESIILKQENKMAQILLVIGIFAVAIVGMGLSLHFSKYKKRPSGCCGGKHCETNGAHHDDPEAHANHSCYKDKVNFVNSHKS